MKFKGLIAVASPSPRPSPRRRPRPSRRSPSSRPRASSTARGDAAVAQRRGGRRRRQDHGRRLGPGRSRPAPRSSTSATPRSCPASSTPTCTSPASRATTTTATPSEHHAPDRRRAGHPRHRPTRARRSWPASPRCATSAPPTTSTSACATPSTTAWSPDRACWSRCTPSGRAAATADDTGFPLTCGSATSRGSHRRHRQRARSSSATRCAIQLKYGADVIKVCASGGVLSLTDAVDTPAAHAGGDGRPRRRGASPRQQGARRTPTATAGAKVAIRAGIDSIEHGSFLDDEALRMMKDRGTYLVPTLLAGEYGADGPRQLPARDRRQGQGRGGRAHATTFRNALKPGVKIAFGTDSAVEPARPERQGVRPDGRASA